jgi:hypothetical protein
MITEEQDERQAALTAIADALTEQEVQTIMDRTIANSPSFHGTVASLLSLADRTTGYAGLIDPFYASLRGHEKLPPGFGRRFAVLALCLLGEELSYMGVMKLLLRAHLLPGEPVVLTWRHHSTSPMRAVTAYVAEGETWRYLVTHAWDGRVLLCRYRKTWDREDPDSLEPVRQAAETAIEVASVTDGRQTADLYERGQDIPWCPVWCHPGRPALRTTTEG